MRDRTYKGVSLFSGAGGLDVGFEQAGVEVVFANELDPDAADAYCANRPDNPNVMHRGDIVAFSDELEAMENIDVLFGGPPCQGFSVAGKMDPDDERSLLVFAFLDAVATVRPRLFVMENVKALGRSPRWESVRERLNSIAHSLGYETQPMVLDATDYGVPQKRERFFFVGIRQDTAHEALSNLPSRLQLHAAKGATVRSTLSALPRFGDAGNPESSVAAVRLAKNPILRPSAYTRLAQDLVKKQGGCQAQALPATPHPRESPQELRHPGHGNILRTVPSPGLLALDCLDLLPAHIQKVTNGFRGLSRAIHLFQGIDEPISHRDVRLTNLGVTLIQMSLLTWRVVVRLLCASKDTEKGVLLEPSFGNHLLT